MSETTAGVAAPPPTGSRIPLVLRVVGGCVVVAVVVGIGVVAERLTDDELTLPDEVVGIAADDSDEALEVLDAGDRRRARDDAQERWAFNSRELSSAYDGAEAVTRHYGTLLNADAQLLVTAVRAESTPPLPISFDDAQALRIAAPTNELVEDGDVTCLLTRDPSPRRDDEPTEEQLAPMAVLCQRTGDDLTVRVFASGEPDLEVVVDATEEVWGDVS